MTVIDRKRIIADIGKLVTNGNTKGKCVDVAPEDVSLWTEIDDPNYIAVTRPEE